MTSQACTHERRFGIDVKFKLRAHLNHCIARKVRLRVNAA